MSTPCSRPEKAAPDVAYQVDGNRVAFRISGEDFESVQGVVSSLMGMPSVVFGEFEIPRLRAGQCVALGHVFLGASR